MNEWQKIVYQQIKEQGLLAEDPSTERLGKKALMNTMMHILSILAYLKNIKVHE